MLRWWGEGGGGARERGAGLVGGLAFVNMVESCEHIISTHTAGTQGPEKNWEGPAMLLFLF